MIEIDKRNLIVVSEMGDTIKFQNFDAYSEEGDNFSIEDDDGELVKQAKSHFKKYHQIFRIDTITDICFLSTD